MTFGEKNPDGNIYAQQLHTYSVRMNDHVIFFLGRADDVKYRIPQ
jgi:hypothetical protein